MVALKNIRRKKNNRHLRKMKIAILSLTCCEGCQIALLDLGSRFFQLTERIDWRLFRLLKDERPEKNTHFDLAFIEGNPTNLEQITALKQVRKNSDLLIVLGNCADMGGIQEIKNYHQPQKILRLVYKDPRGISNTEIRAVENFVEIDGVLRTCPLNAEEFLQFVCDFLNRKKFKIPERPVCYECQINEYECLLQKGQICFGPWVIGGCRAICLKSGQPCWGCRGLLRGADNKKIMQTLQSIATKEEILKQAEVFGLRDEIEKKYE